MAIKPGWILLGLVTLWALLLAVQLANTRRQIAGLRSEVQKLQAAQKQGPRGYALPLPGACLPKTNSDLPGADRPYRKGKNPGFVFVDGDACVPVRYGTGVIAAASGEVIKAESDFKEMSKAEFSALLKAVAGGANPQQMDKLRGREVWIRHEQGFVTVYAHLSEIAPGIKVGAKVLKGEWIGQVGNSGTEAGIQGDKTVARLLFELWDGEPDKDRFFGQDTAPELLRAKAKLQFGLP